MGKGYRVGGGVCVRTSPVSHGPRAFVWHGLWEGASPPQALEPGKILISPCSPVPRARPPHPDHQTHSELQRVTFLIIYLQMGGSDPRAEKFLRIKHL